MEVRQVHAKRGLQWIINGFYLFRKTPLIWIALCSLLLLIAATMSLIPMVGRLLFTLLSPVFLAGLMVGCRALEQDQELEIAHLFAGLNKSPAALITVGGVYLVGQVLIVGVAMMIGGSVLMDLLVNGKRVDENELMDVSGDMLSASLVALTLTVPLMMATWFAPLLVIFKNMLPFAAIRLSFIACLRNIVPLQIYAFALVILMTLAALPYGLGLFVMVPTMFASIYASYVDLFPDVVIQEETSAAEIQSGQ